MNAMLLNLGLVPIPPVPKPTKEKKEKVIKARPPRTVKQRLSSAELCARMHEVRQAKYQIDKDKVVAFVGQKKEITVKDLCMRFKWTYAKSYDILFRLKQEGRISSVGLSKAMVYVPCP